MAESLGVSLLRYLTRSAGFGYGGAQAAGAEPDSDGGFDRGVAVGFDDGAGFIGNDGVPAFEDLQRAELGEMCQQRVEGAAAAGQAQTDTMPDRGLGGFDTAPRRGKAEPEILPPEASGVVVETAPLDGETRADLLA